MEDHSVNNELQAIDCRDRKFNYTLIVSHLKFYYIVCYEFSGEIVIITGPQQNSVIN